VILCVRNHRSQHEPWEREQCHAIDEDSLLWLTRRAVGQSQAIT
jgi:hypothetical protein